MTASQYPLSRPTLVTLWYISGSWWTNGSGICLGKAFALYVEGRRFDSRAGMFPDIFLSGVFAVQESIYIVLV